MATLGDPDGALTVGAGYAYAGESGTAVAMLAGERRVSRRMKAITENWLWQDGPQLLSGGMRFIGDRLSADLGLVFMETPDADAGVGRDFEVARFLRTDL